MTGEILKEEKRGILFLQVEGGGSWSMVSIQDALGDLRFFERNDELSDLLYAALYKMKAGQTGFVCSEDADFVDPEAFEE
jgi:hypothetical protein